MGTSCSEPTAPSPAAGGTPSSAASPAARVVLASFPAHGAHLRNADIEGLLLSFAGLGCNTRTMHDKWVLATEELLDVTIPFPVVADVDAKISGQLGLIRHGARRDARNLLPASLAVVGDPSGKVAHVLQYPEAAGRNFHELLRALDALQLTFIHPHVACGVNWMGGEDVFVTNDVMPSRAKELFPRGFVEIRPWFRLAPPPNLDIVDAAAEALQEGGRESRVRGLDASR